MKSQTFAIAALALASFLSPPPASAESAWTTDADAAFAAAKKSGKLVLVELYADWCGWCKVMDAQVFSTPAFRNYAQRFVLLRADIEDGGDGSEIGHRFRTSSLPTLLLLDANQALIAEIEGFLETDRLLPRLDAEEQKYARFLAAYEAILAGSDAASWLAKAKEMHARGDGARSAKLYEKALAGGSLRGDRLSWARLQLADSYRMDSRFDAAKATARALRATLASVADRTSETAMIAERVELMLLYIAGGEHDCGDAASALAAFEKGYPKSPYLADARKAFRATRTDAGSQCS